MISVLLATYNRATSIPAVLENLCALEAPEGGWELFVVDNGSTDATREVVTAFEGRLPLTYVHEPAPGKSAALNTGLALLSGELVVLTDDDIFPRPDWLPTLQAVADAHPDHAVFGGAIVPRWPSPPPAWVTEWVPVGTAFAMTDPALPEGPILPYLVFGGNMAVRAEVFRAGHRFDTRLGPGQQTAMGDEAEFVSRVCRAGYQAWYTSSAVVEHYVRPEQLEQSWLLERAFRAGRAEFRGVMQSEPVPERLVLRLPTWLLRSFVRASVRFAAARFSRDPEKRFRTAWEAAFLRGEVVESRIMYRGARTGSTP